MTCCDRTIQNAATLEKTAEGIAVHVDKSVDPKKVFAMVESCQTGRCDCMSEEVKAKVSAMEVSQGTEGTTIRIHGTVSEEEIQEVMGRSTKAL
ncbi:hypothetical protein [Acidithiobacillus sulfuriphilus]|uniref:Uncharacterized protein n=2 Tax=Acidithiobacillus sulfuriphilus TaxID=1867749 RepID=A0A3M8RET8_9PROT|nr:hypothetical protein [Acidithiobacillus sulfuriphilus]RNF67119.1 hypothetical protein EC580_04350 [Acidithiobacillus sulfuriphilus]